MKRLLRIKHMLFVWRALLLTWSRSRNITRLTHLAFTMSVSGSIACQRTERSTAENVAQAESRPNREALESLTTILHTFDADLDEPQRVVIRDSVSWAGMWEKLVGRYIPPPAVPYVNFGSTLVVVATSGSQGTSGYDIRVDSARVQDGELVIYVLETRPGRSCNISAMAVTNPAHAVQVWRIVERERFVDRLVVRECRGQQR